MTKSNTKKAVKTIAPSVSAQTLSYVSGKARSEENIKRAKAVSGMSMENALAHYATLYPKGAKTHLNYDISKIGSLKLG